MQSHSDVYLDAETVTESDGATPEFLKCFAEELLGKSLVCAYTNLVRCLQPGYRMICPLIHQGLFQMFKFLIIPVFL